MINNFFKTGWRNFVRYKGYNLLNIASTAIGLTMGLLIFIYVSHENSFDNFHIQKRHIFNLILSSEVDGNKIQFPGTSPATSMIVKDTEPTVKSYMRIFEPRMEVTIVKDILLKERFAEDDFLFVDSNFFDFFSFKLFSGEEKSILDDPFSLIITSDMAMKYFGSQDPIGNVLYIKLDEKFFPFTIKGIVRDAPSNSSIQFKFLTSISSLEKITKDSDLRSSQKIDVGNFLTFVNLEDPFKAMDVQASINDQLKHASENNSLMLSLINIENLHLQANFDRDTESRYLMVFPLIAFLILLLVSINYMSLFVAKATLRAKEIGLRKVIGASRFQIVIQFYIESVFFIIPAFVVSYVLCFLVLPIFTNLLEIKIDSAFLLDGQLLGSLFILLALTSFISGSYPALILSGFNPIASLKGKMSSSAMGAMVRNFFTVLQYIITIGLVICGSIIYAQLYFLKHKDSGINRKNTVMVPFNNTITNYSALKGDIQNISDVIGIATSQYPMYRGYDIIFSQSKSGEDGILLVKYLVDKHFIPLLGIEWAFPPLHESGLNNFDKVILNESAITELELDRNNPIGNQIRNGNDNLEVSGVVKNFNFSSMNYKEKPMAIFLSSDTTSNWDTNGGCLYIKVKKGSDIAEVVNSVRNIYHRYDKETPFNYIWMDEAFNYQYRSEGRLALILTSFSAITLVMASVGLFGVVSFSLMNRAKEISIRKIHGAGFFNLARLLSIDFFKLILIAIVVATPLSWWVMQQWIQDFHYRVTFHSWLFILPNVAVFIIAGITIGYFVFKAALRSSIHILRSDN